MDENCLTNAHEEKMNESVEHGSYWSVVIDVTIRVTIYIHVCIYIYIYVVKLYEKEDLIFF